MLLLGQHCSVLLSQCIIHICQFASSESSPIYVTLVVPILAVNLGQAALWNKSHI